MVPLAVIPPALMLVGKYLVTSVVVMKITGFVLSVVTSPTNFGSRESIVQHVEHVIEGLDRCGISIGDDRRKLLMEELEVLRSSCLKGWTEPHETEALLSVFKFLSWAHAKSTAYGTSALAASHSNAVGDWMWNAGANALDALFPRRV